MLHRHSVRPSKKLGQYFLIDKNILTKIIKASDLSKKDLVIEIGPGVGTITEKLAQKAGYVIAIEKDKKMIEVLKETTGCYKNVEIIQGDILKFFQEGDIGECRLQVTKNYKVVANLPYYLTSPAIRMFLEDEDTYPHLRCKPSEMILLIQKEEAERICAKPGQMNILSIIVQFYGKPEIIDFVPRRASWPVPKVDFAVLKISQISTPQISQMQKELLFKIVKAGFSSRRKQLVNTLSEKLSISKKQIKEILLKIGTNPTVRAQELSIEKWLELTNILLRNLKRKVENQVQNF